MADTIALMRKRVLDMAIRGELVIQRKEEGTAEELLNLIKQNENITKEDSTFEIENKDIPFNIPKNWEWVKLGNIFKITSSKRITKSQWSEYGVPFYRARDIVALRNDSFIDSLNISFELFEEIKKKYGAPKYNDLMVTGVGSIGVPYIVKEDEEFYFKDATILWLKNIFNVRAEYFYYLFESSFLHESIVNGSRGTTVATYTISRANNELVPLPPLAEQNRIVSKIEEIFAVIDQIAERKAEALSIIRNMRQKALQEAIMGLLVEQDETDEPAYFLYEKIQAKKEQLVKEKKIKKDKSLPEIDAEEVPFEIPKNWRWTRLGDLGFFKKGPFGSALTKSIFVEDSSESIKVYEQKNAIQSDCTLGEYFITKDYYEEKMASNTVMPGDIIVSCAGTIGKSYIIPDGARLGIINQALMRIRVYTINKQYFRLIFNHVIQTDGAQGKGSAIKNIPPMNVLNNLLVPLPPLAEQERIVEKIDEIMAICDQMEAIFDGSSEVKENFKVV
jgi:type I restriction enzyme S subunit